MPAILIVALVLICILLVLGIIAFFVKPRTIYSNKDERNPVENMRVIFVYDESDEENADGVRGHLEVVGEEPIHNNLYCGYTAFVFRLSAVVTGISYHYCGN